MEGTKLDGFDGRISRLISTTKSSNRRTIRVQERFGNPAESGLSSSPSSQARLHQGNYPGPSAKNQKKNLFPVEVYMENSFGLSSVFIVTNTFLRQDPGHRKALCRFYESRTEEAEGKLIRSVPAEDANVEQFLAGELAFSELEDLRVNRDNSDNEFHDPVASGAYTESPPSKRLRSDGN